ncbi:MAG: 3-keto-5-aminohexanoate cleavage protein [Gammaproteobacteria bacterium]|nr:3-keto-5-aminohexanoate cleavage protein [Gammaproteobacteria bacterium]MDH5303704.1 3-keto-5-aminohexanoate cleavage protein [Gammaproteobacteria bacterium]MDH5322673.1 3-keto-5-aminohexanoate cleavage protein [Gammaproteobacteria bacterium]
MANKVIITCAVTGSIHTPTMSPHLPITPQEIADQAVAAAEAGASILHLHARDPATGQPTADPAVFMQFLPEIRKRCDAVINITTGGSSLMTLEQRLAAPILAEPEMASLNMGSMNFGLFPMKKRHAEWRFDWEPKLLDATREVVFQNTFANIEQIFRTLGDGCGTRFEFECYDVGHIQTLAFYLREGLIRKPLFVQFVLGVLGGIDASPESLLHMKATADRLLGTEYRFSVLSAGRMQIPLATVGAILGGNVRVGLEDSLLIAKNTLARSNAEQVEKIRRILEELGHEIATPAEARAMLHLKGADRVAF